MCVRAVRTDFEAVMCGAVRRCDVVGVGDERGGETGCYSRKQRDAVFHTTP